MVNEINEKGKDAIIPKIEWLISWKSLTYGNVHLVGFRKAAYIAAAAAK